MLFRSALNMHRDIIVGHFSQPDIDRDKSLHHCIFLVGFPKLNVTQKGVIKVHSEVELWNIGIFIPLLPSFLA